MDRFWSKVDKSGECWLWRGARNKSGYGIFWNIAAKRRERAHRVAWELTNGPIPRGRNACHRCDNPPCVRPDHLFIGSHADNAKDMWGKGRARHFTGRPQGGELNYAHKLTDQGVREIRRLRAEGLLHREIAARLGVHQATVSCVLRGLTWTHVQ